MLCVETAAPVVPNCDSLRQMAFILDNNTTVFIPPLYYQYFPLPPYPIRYADWIALGWILAGILITAFMPRRIVDSVEELYGTEEPVGIAGPSVYPPEATPGTAPA